MMRLLRSPPFKIAVAFTVSVCLSAYVVSAIVYSQVYAADLDLVSSLLREEIEATKIETLPIVESQLQRRLTQDLRHIDYVGLYDGVGRLVFGNVEAGLQVPRDDRIHLLRTRSPRKSGVRKEEAVFIAAPRDDGGVIVLGRTLTYVDHVGTAVRRGFLLALTPVVLLALAAGLWASRQAWRRLSAIEKAIMRVIAGEVHVRLPVDGRNGEIADLVASVNGMLDEIVRLLFQIKNVGDNIAHDLRAPLAVMRLKLERSLSSGTENELRSIVSDTLEDLDRAASSVAALLRISAIEGRTKRERFTSVDLETVCRHTSEFFEPLAEEKGVILDFRSNPACALGDDDLLHEAVANLVDNAIKYTPRDGRVVISCGGPDYLVRVSDDGPGIAVDERDKVLDRYYRAEGTDRTPGSGLGFLF